jgi:hypothetical protein
MTLSVTRQALVAMKDLLAQRDTAGNQALRLIADVDYKFAFVLDIPRNDDVIVVFDEMTVLLLEPHLSSELDGMTLDLKKVADGPAWTLKKGNAT